MAVKTSHKVVWSRERWDSEGNKRSTTNRKKNGAERTDEEGWPDPSLPHVDVARRSQRIAIVVSASLEHATLSTVTLEMLVRERERVLF